MEEDNDGPPSSKKMKKKGKGRTISLTIFFDFL